MNNGTFPGEELRAQREALGLTPQDVFAEARIPTAYVEALERGDLEVLPVPGYAAAFLRTYCRLLELPPERFVDSFRAYARQMGHAPPLPRKTRPGLPTWKDDLLVWAAISAILLLGWVTYALVVRPQAGVTDNRVDAGAREMVVPRPPAELDF